MVIVTDQFPECEKAPAYFSSSGRRGDIGCEPGPTRQSSDSSAIDTQPWARFYGRREIREQHGTKALAEYVTKLEAGMDGSVNESMDDSYSTRDIDVEIPPETVPECLSNLNEHGYPRSEILQLEAGIIINHFMSQPGEAGNKQELQLAA